jgi:hypothetical protein
LDVFADAVALVGRDAYLFGESVIAMHGLAPTNPSSIKVATPHKIRKTLPRHLIVITRQEDEQVTKYEGIPSQSVADAIRSCRTTMMVERLLTAIREVQRQGFIKKDEAARLSKEIRSAKKYTKQQAEPRQGTTAQLQESVRCAHTDGQRNNRPTPA